jgi:hypothetical protein
MSIELVVVAYPSTPVSQKFFATVKVRGEYFESGSQTPSGTLVSGAPADHPLHQALKKAGIEPYYSLHTEAELRSALVTVGLSEADIEAKFQSARKWNTTITVHQ